MKRTISILITVLLLLSTLPMTVFAAGTELAETGDTILYYADVTNDKPIAGKTPS